MNFENELEIRLNDVRQKELEQEAKLKQAKAESDLVLKTKAIIDPLLETVAKKFTNAKTEPTHETKNNGEVEYRFGTGYCCVIDFKADRKFGFAEPCKFAFEVNPIDVATEEIKITSTYVQGQAQVSNYSSLLLDLRQEDNIVYTGSFNSESIKKIVEKVILETLDNVRVTK